MRMGKCQKSEGGGGNILLLRSGGYTKQTVLARSVINAWFLVNYQELEKKCNCGEL